MSSVMLHKTVAWKLPAAGVFRFLNRTLIINFRTPESFAKSGTNKRYNSWDHDNCRTFSTNSSIANYHINTRTILESCGRQSTFLRNLYLNRSLHTGVSRCMAADETGGNKGSDGEGKKHRNTLTKVHGEAPTEPYIGGYRNPIDMFKNEMKVLKGTMNADDILPVPRHCDIVIIGGGAIGMSTAYWLKQRNPRGYEVTVIERDPTYSRAATTLSAGGIRQQFSLEENIQMSLFGAEFLRKIKERLSVLDFEPPDISFNHQGYLFMASKEGAEGLKQSYEKQISLGARVDLMTREKLKERFPWMNTSDVELATYGIQNEGWWDPWLYLCALKTKAASLGTKFVTGEVVGFTTAEHNCPIVLPGSTLGTTGARMVEGSVSKRDVLRNVHVRTSDGKVHPIQFAMCANCAGPWARDIARLAGIGTGKDILSVDIPVEPRKRYVYMFHCADGPGLDTPMIIDPTGVYVRREGLGGNYICGASPPPGKEEPDISDLTVDYEFFEEFVWPQLAHRVPAFENLKLKSAWAGYYDYNYYDQNLIIGNHPYHRNMFMAVGSSGHGLQHSPAIGRAMMEYMTDDGFKTIDLSRMCFDRILDDINLVEMEIV